MLVGWVLGSLVGDEEETNESVVTQLCGSVPTLTIFAHDWDLHLHR